MNPVRILHVIDSGGVFGAEVMLLNLMREQLALGMEPVLLSIGTPGQGDKDVELRARESSLEVVTMRMKAGLNLKGGRSVAAYAGQHGFHVMHSHGYKGNILLGLIGARRRGMPLITTLHGWVATRSLSKLYIYNLLDSFCLRWIDAVVLVNEAMKNHALLRRRNLANTYVIDNGIDGHTATTTTLHPDQAPAPLRHLKQEVLKLVAVGRLSREKGFRDLIDAAVLLREKIPDFQLCIIGEGPQRSALQEQIDTLKLQTLVHLCGYVKNAADWLSLFDIMVMPSLTEGLPMVLLEAMKNRVAVVATRVGGIPNVLEEGRCGWLLPPGDTAALADTLYQAACNSEQTKTRVAEARRAFEHRYTSAVMASRYKEVYDQVWRDYQALYTVTR